jgi:hypothetical protein
MSVNRRPPAHEIPIVYAERQGMGLAPKGPSTGGRLTRPRIDLEPTGFELKI